jgi:D-xylose transport system permease protein
LQNEGPVKRFFRATEIDDRMLGMVAALLLIWCAFDIASGILRGNFGGLLGGSFLTPRNLWTCWCRPRPSPSCPRAWCC